MSSPVLCLRRGGLAAYCAKSRRDECPDVEISDVKKTLSSRKKGLGWFQRVPRIRVRRPENKCPDQVMELAILNERLAGASPWEVRRQVEYLKKRQGNWDLVYDIIVRREAAATLELIEEANDKIEEALSEERKETRSVIDLKRDLITLEEEVNNAHQKLHSTEMRVRQNLQRIQQLKAAAEILGPATQDSTPEITPGIERGIMDHWYPVAFSKDLSSAEKIFSFEFFDTPWILFRDKDGSPGCILDECAHRACPLSIGKIVDGKISCPYHGWEYTTKGECTKMPSTVFRKGVSIISLPVSEKDGLLWVWPGSIQKMEEENHQVPNFAALPDGFSICSEIEMTAQLSQGLVLENLLDTHMPLMLTSWLKSDRSSSTSARKRAMMENPIIDLSFEPPCNVLSLSSLDNPVTLDQNFKKKSEKKSFHQLHVCLPSSKDHVRILQRTSINFFKWMHHLPPMTSFFENMARQALEEDLDLARAQQERMMKYGSHKINP